MTWTKEHRSDYYKNYRINNKKRLGVYRKKYLLDNSEILRIKNKEYRLANIEKITTYQKANKQKACDYNAAYSKLHPEKSGLNNKKYRQNLPDKYIKNLLIVQGKRYGCNAENITQELINLKRSQLLLFREIRDFKREVQNGTNRTRNQRT